MAIGRTFKEALQKALRSLEIKRFGLCGDGRETRVDEETLRRKLSVPNAERIFYLAQAFEDGMSIEEIFGLTKIDRWFLQNIAQVVAGNGSLAYHRPDFAFAASEEAWLFRSTARPFVQAKTEKKSATSAKPPVLSRPIGWSIPARQNSRPTRRTIIPPTASENEIRAERETQNHDPRRRPEPHRPGNRVRLLLRPCRFRAARARLRDHHGQLESGNGFDRLRHERQTLFRAAHATKTCSTFTSRKSRRA